MKPEYSLPYLKKPANGPYPWWFEVLTVVSTKIGVFLPATPSRLVGVYKRFRGTYCLRHQGDELLIALVMEAVNTNLHGFTTQKTANFGPYRF
jgi:hypothetical protein